MVNEQALGKLGERSRQEVRPEDASAVDGSSQNEIAESPGGNDVSDGWGVHNDGEGRALVSAIDCLVAAGCDDCADRVERGEGTLSLRGHDISRFCLINDVSCSCNLTIL